ncbi:hypothetical protein ACTFIZ_009246 [Dictyostelium cf. discoideum]
MERDQKKTDSSPTPEKLNPNYYHQASSSALTNVNNDEPPIALAYEVKHVSCQPQKIPNINELVPEDKNPNVNELFPEDKNPNALFLKIFKNKYLSGEIYKNLFYKYNSNNTDKLSARRIANSINKGGPPKCEKEIISTIQFIRGNNYKNSEFFRHLFTHPSDNSGSSGNVSSTGSGGEGQQIDFGDFNKWLTIIVQSKNIAALQMFLFVFSIDYRMVKNIVLELIKENKYLVNNSKGDHAFNLNIKQYFQWETVGDEPNIDICIQKIIIIEASFRNDFPSLKNYIAKFINNIKDNKTVSGGRSYYGSSFERGFIKTVLLTGNMLLIEEVAMSNVIDAQRNSEIIFRSINSEIIMDLVFKYYKDLLFLENNFNYIYLNRGLIEHYEILMAKLNRKALVNSFDDMDRKLKSSHKQSIFTLFINASSNPRVYFISDEIKQSYFQNIHLVSDYETFIRMLQALKIHSPIQVNGYFSPSLSKSMSNNIILKQIINIHLKYKFKSYYFYIQNFNPKTFIIIPYQILLYSLVENNRIGEALEYFENCPTIFNKSLFLKIKYDFRFEKTNIQIFEELLNGCNLLK